jgi:transposase, IS30 family
VSKLAANAELAGLVAAKLDDDWSPQQIAQWLRREHSGAAEMRVSRESIDRDVYMPSRKALEASMFHHLRSDRSIRRPLGKRSSYGRGQIRNTVSIRERPVEAGTREVAGHRERLTRASTRRCAVSHGVADITTQLEWNECSLALTLVVVKLNVQFLRR